jgi:DNA-binding transcriptional LysR family regulator
MFKYIIYSFMLSITLRHYEYIVGVADAGSLTKAAVHLNVSQPSLSVAITRVEQILGSPIFVRGNGAALKITPYGHRFLESARLVLALAAKTEKKQETVPKFVLGCFDDLAPWHLATALKRLGASFPDIEFRGIGGGFAYLERDLAEGRIDLAISYDIGFDKTFNRHAIKQVLPVAFLCVDHPLADNSSVELATLLDYPLLLSSEELSERFMRNLFEQMQLSATVRQTVASLEMMRSLAAHGMGIGISYSRPPSDLSYDGTALVTVPISTPAAAADIKLIWSALREPEPLFDDIMRVLTTPDGRTFGVDA